MDARAYSTVDTALSASAGSNSGMRMPPSANSASAATKAGTVSSMNTTDRGHMAAGLPLLITLFVHVGRLCEAAPASRTAAGASLSATQRRAGQIRRFRELLVKHAREHRPVDFYAQTLGTTVAQLGRICREEISSSPLAVINEHLVREAQRALVYSHMSVKQIAHDLEFDDIAYFSRYFRKQTGVTPTQFQKEAIRALAIDRRGA